MSPQGAERREPGQGPRCEDLGAHPGGLRGAGLGEVAAYRFKCDLNEYGKTPAFWNAFPELNHNEIVGWNQLADVTSRSFLLILLRDSAEHPRVDLRIDITKALVEDNLAEVTEVRSEGIGALARVFSLILVTQLAAIYVALAYGIDPGPVEVIERLKKQLADQ